MNASPVLGWVPGDLVPTSTPAYEWLKTYVLTKAIQRTYQEPVKVRVINQFFTRLEDYDRTVPEHSHGYLREVFLCVRDQPVVYARTTVTNPTPEVKESIVTLGDRPIGVNLLYNNAKVRRSPFCYRQFTALEDTYPSVPAEFRNSEVWARRSTFHWDQTNIHITEFFSPKIKNYVPEDQPSFPSPKLVG